jgi:hypothetical protein
MLANEFEDAKNVKSGDLNRPTIKLDSTQLSFKKVDLLQRFESPPKEDHPDIRPKPIKFPSNFFSLILSQPQSEVKEVKLLNSTICYQKLNPCLHEKMHFTQSILETMDGLTVYSGDSMNETDDFEFNRQIFLDKQIEVHQSDGNKLRELQIVNKELIKKIKNLEIFEQESKEKIQSLIDENAILKNEIVKYKELSNSSALKTLSFNTKNLNSFAKKEENKNNPLVKHSDEGITTKRNSFSKTPVDVSTHRQYKLIDNQIQITGDTINSYGNYAIQDQRGEYPYSNIKINTNNGVLADKIPAKPQNPSMSEDIQNKNNLKTSNRSIQFDNLQAIQNNIPNPSLNRRYTDNTLRTNQVPESIHFGRFTEQPSHINKDQDNYSFGRIGNPSSSRSVIRIDKDNFSPKSINLPKEKVCFSKLPSSSRQLLIESEGMISSHQTHFWPTSCSNRFVQDHNPSISPMYFPSQRTIAFQKEDEVADQPKVVYSSRSYVTKKCRVE